MIYADTDFFIALVKDDDWLQDRAATIAREHAGDIYTSRATLLELLMISDRFDFDRMQALSYALDIASIAEDEAVLFQAADYMDAHGLTASTRTISPTPTRTRLSLRIPSSTT